MSGELLTVQAAAAALQVHPETVRRLWSRVAIAADGECWLWKGYVAPNGYGQATFLGRKTTAHRAIYQSIYGEISRDLEVDHLCRNRSCCNPAHLESVTPRVNVLRSESVSALNARKTHCPSGHPYSGDNLSVKRSGARSCKACARERRRRQALKAKVSKYGAESVGIDMRGRHGNYRGGDFTKPPGMEMYYTASEAARTAGCTHGAMRQRIRRGRVHAALVGDRYLIHPNEVAAWRNC